MNLLIVIFLLKGVKDRIVNSTFYNFAAILVSFTFQSDDKLEVLPLPNIAKIQIFVKYGEELGCQMGHTYAKIVVRP